MRAAIINNDDYQEIMIAVYDLMKKGESNLSDTEMAELKEIAMAVEKYEDNVLNLKPKRS